MAWIAILSDVHGNVGALRQALADARAQGATAFVHLGDLGNGEAHPVLATVQPRSVVGNWEVSSWQNLPSPWREQVRTWPFQIQEDEVIFCHASPVWPAEVRTLEDAARYVREHGSWFALFPALHQDEEARWAAFATLAEKGARLAFHGHTHVQEIWTLTPDNRMRRLSTTEFTVADDESLYLVGVGSVGHPLDGEGICYALWNPETRHVRLRRLVEERTR